MSKFTTGLSTVLFMNVLYMSFRWEYNSTRSKYRAKNSPAQYIEQVCSLNSQLTSDQCHTYFRSPATLEI